MRFWGFVFIVFVIGCASHDPVSVPVVSDYFPMKTGAWWMYAVDSVVTDQSVATTYSYQLRIQVTDSFPTPEGDFTWVLQRSKRKDDTSPWSSMNTWSARVNNYQLVIMEGNVPYIRISSPLANGSYWDGNALNDLGGTEKCPGGATYTCDIFTIGNFAQPYSVPGKSFSQSLTVSENDEEDFLTEDVRSEIFAIKVGLVYREIIQLNFCNDLDCLGQQIVEQGVNYKQTFTSYGGL